MVTFFKVVGWVMATISGLLVWNILPETRAIISCGMVVAFICYGISIVVGVAVKRLIGDELLELRLQCNAVANRLEFMVTCPCRFPPVEVRVRPSEGRTNEASQVYGRADYWRAARA